MKLKDIDRALLAVLAVELALLVAGLNVEDHFIGVLAVIGFIMASVLSIYGDLLTENKGINYINIFLALMLSLEVIALASIVGEPAILYLVMMGYSLLTLISVQIIASSAGIGRWFLLTTIFMIYILSLALFEGVYVQVTIATMMAIFISLGFISLTAYKYESESSRNIRG